MAEQRKPLVTLTISHPAKPPSRMEMFNGELFWGRTFKDILGDPIPAEADRGGYVRLRINGRWFPARQKVLYSREQAYRIIVEKIRSYYEVVETGTDH